MGIIIFSQIIWISCHRDMLQNCVNQKLLVFGFNLRNEFALQISNEKFVFLIQCATVLCYVMLNVQHQIYCCCCYQTVWLDIRFPTEMTLFTVTFNMLRCRMEWFKNVDPFFLKLGRNGCVVVKFCPWFKFYFPLFKTHYHTLPYPKTKENII